VHPAASAFRIRAAEPRDVAALVDLRVALFRELKVGPTAERESEFRLVCDRAFTDVLARGRGLAWLAESAAGEPIGSNVLLLFPRIPSPNCLIAEEGYVLSVYTRPEWRGRGVATGLIRESIEEARRRGLARIRLHATEDGRRVYEAAGFKFRTDEMELWL